MDLWTCEAAGNVRAMAYGRQSHKVAEKGNKELYRMLASKSHLLSFLCLLSTIWIEHDLDVHLVTMSHQECSDRQPSSAFLDGMALP